MDLRYCRSGYKKTKLHPEHFIDNIFGGNCQPSPPAKRRPNAASKTNCVMRAKIIYVIWLCSEISEKTVTGLLDVAEKYPSPIAALPIGSDRKFLSRTNGRFHELMKRYAFPWNSCLPPYGYLWKSPQVPLKI